MPEAYRAHPLLDPLLPSRQRTTARFWLGVHRSRGSRDGKAARPVLATSGGLRLSPDPGDVPASLFADADKYLDDLLALAPPGAGGLRVLDSTREMNDLDRLLRAAIEASTSRQRYEAQRKLYLAKLLFDIDHCRSVLDGPRHRALFESLLARTLWSQAEEAGGEREICCRLTSVRSGGDRLELGVRPDAGGRCWRFNMRALRSEVGEPGIDVYDYRTRFKRDAADLEPKRSSEGMLSLAETPRWPGLGRRSGSILSKMIRQGIADPHMVQDMLGAKFIVGDRSRVYALDRRLTRALGGPFHFRDRVDTLAGESDRAQLNRHSSAGFQVLKQIASILVEDPAGAAPYLFPIEIQIHPLESYLRTLHDAHYSSHAAYKRRQTFEGLLPILFPPEVYGDELREQAPNPLDGDV